MKKRFVIADTHFGHKGITGFLRADGKPLRPWDNSDDMDEALVERWNAVVGPHDRAYILGDVVINKRALQTVGRLNGKKVLVAGNHDIFGAKAYLEFFEDVRAYKVIDGTDGPRAILSHIPIHPDQIRRFKVNIHGHLHSNVVENPASFWGGKTPDARFICVSAEHTNYTPVDLETLLTTK